jgi:chitodextrinase
VIVAVVLLASTALVLISGATTPAATSGLVAAYAFDEGSGTTVADASGNGNTGTVANATWVAGKYGQALSFNGTSSRVTVPNSASLQLSAGLTLEAWVNPATTTAAWRDVIYKGNDNYYLEGTSDHSGAPAGGGTFGTSYGTATLAVNTWSYLAVSYDKTTVRMYINGIQVGSLAATAAIASSTNPLSIGSDSIWGQYFSGLIDNVRVYNTALTASQIQTDMTTPVAPPAPDTTPPSAPTGLAVSGVGPTSMTLSWNASSDNVGVTGYQLYLGGSEIGTSLTTSYLFTGLTCGTSYTLGVAAVDGAGNVSGIATIGQQTASCSDTSPPSAPGTLSASAVSAGEIDLIWGAATDNVGVTGYRILRCQGSGCTNFALLIQPAGTATTYKDTGLSAGTSYSYEVQAFDAAGNQGPFSNAVSATTVATAGGGLVAAYSFDEGSGSTVGDSSGNGNTGTVSGATWTNAGKYGGALVFNGTTSTVNVPNTASLQLSSGMTLEAWVNPASVTSAWRDVIYKGNDNYYLEGTSGGSGVPAGGGTFAGSNANAFATGALPTNAWSFLTLTYDGATLRLYVNGTQVATQAKTGAIASSTNQLQIGGDSLYGQHFNGMIDQIRIYNTALTASQIQTDMNGGATLPTAPTNLSASFTSSTEIDLSWGSSTDAAGVTGYRVERCQGAGCSNFAQIATPSGTTYNDTGLVAGNSYSYRVRAVDAAGSVGPYSSVATAFTGLVVSPGQYAITPGLVEQYSAGGASGVTWSVDGIAGGNATVGTITSSGLYTASSSVGQHTVTATTSSASASATVYITNYAGTMTFHNDNMRTGQNLSETVLTPANVNSSSFGKLFSYPLDGLTFASPLYAENVAIPGQGSHNVVYVATENDSVYAFDADGRTSTPLWHDSFINPANGVTTVPPDDTGETGDIPNEIGITGTPVIDPSTNTMYLVAATKEVSGSTTTYVQRLHALDIRTGAEEPGSPVIIHPTVPGTGADSVSGQVTFNSLYQNQRAGLLLSNGVLYVAWGDHGFVPPYHGWLMAFDPATLALKWAFCTSPDDQSSGIWMDGEGISTDSTGSLYFATGNGSFDAASGERDYGDSVVRLSAAGTVQDYFTPHNQNALNNGDVDLGSGGVMLLPDQPGAHPHELVAGGKGGTVYLVSRDNMGGYNSTNDSQIVQELAGIFPGGTDETGNYSSPVYFSGSVYYAPIGIPVEAFGLTNGLLSTTPTSKTTQTYNGSTSTFTARGGTMAISANGTSNGILWTLQSNGDSTPGTLHAYDPANLAHEFYNSDQAGIRDQLDPWLKFTLPTVANGRVYVVSAGQLTSYGLLP